MQNVAYTIALCIYKNLRLTKTSANIIDLAGTQAPCEPLGRFSPHLYE